MPVVGSPEPVANTLTMPRRASKLGIFWQKSWRFLEGRQKFDELLYLVFQMLRQ
jgi:hypothetical protein